jgi:hypothetical protein
MRRIIRLVISLSNLQSSQKRFVSVLDGMKNYKPGVAILVGPNTSAKQKALASFWKKKLPVVKLPVLDAQHW